MPAPIVFLTLYLGLISGRQPFELQAGPEVRSVRFLVDGRESAVLHAPPWRATVDLGPPFEPREVVAIAFDRDGDEIGRTSQFINLPRPSAELTLVPQTDRSGVPVSLALRWEHVYGARPARATIKIDGQGVRVDAKFQTLLPRLDPAQPHLIEAEMHFKDGSVARRELVIAGNALSDSVSSELTPVAFTGAAVSTNATLDGCFSVKGNPVHARIVETAEADVTVVREPTASEVIGALDPDYFIRSSWRGPARRFHDLSLDRGTLMSYTWPIVRHVEAPGHVASNIFDTSSDVSSKTLGMPAFLTMAYDASASTSPLSPVEQGSRRQFADAVAVAGLANVRAGHRRAIVLVIDCTFALSRDRSTAAPAAVRHYLESVGVPLYVWSLSGPRPDLEEAWGAIDDVSTPNQLTAAVGRLRANVASQRIVWISSDPLTALRVEPDRRCGLEPLARLGR